MSGLYDASMKRVHRMAKELEQREAGGATMKALKVEWVDDSDLNDRHDGSGCMIPVVRLAEVDELIKEAVWAMEMVREAQETWSDPVAKAHVQRCDAFLASQVVTDWRERQKEESA